MSETFLLDSIGTILSLLCTIFMIRAHRAAWIFGFLAVALNVTLYLQKHLFGQVFLECVYLGSTLYGWRQWSPQNKQSLPPVSALSFTQNIQLILLTLVSVAGTAWIFQNLTTSSMPYTDATIVSLGLIAQWLLCRRIWECWHYLLIMDIIITYIQWTRGIPFHVGLHIAYCLMALIGLIRWRKLIRRQKIE